MIGSDITSALAAQLNDPSQTVWTNAVLLPFVKIATRDLGLELANNGIPAVFDDAAEQTIVAGGVVLTSAITDLVVPIDISERSSGSTDVRDYRPVSRAENKLPDRAQTAELSDWIWEEETIKFLGSTAVRKIRVHYMKLFPTITLISDTIVVPLAQNYLHHRTGYYVASGPMNASTLASTFEKDATIAGDKMISVLVKNLQRFPGKRRGFSR